MQTVRLNLINENGTPSPYPGDPTTVTVADVEDVTKVWIGVSTDGLTNQQYPITTPIATILLSYPRVYQGISANVGGSPNVYFNSEDDYNHRLDACCLSASGGSASDSGESVSVTP